jgi:transcriptional regulator with XRE-family HTH domain
MGFSDGLRELRKRKRWSQADAAGAAGVSPRSYQNWENRGTKPGLDALKKLAAAFGVTADELLDGAGNDASAPRTKGKR